MTVALYCRVSTDEQAEKGTSIDSQMERLEAFCKSQGIDDFQFYVDDGYSGAILDRPQLKRMIRHIEKGSIESVIVYKLDRMSRSLRDTLYLIEDVFKPHNTTFRSATEAFDTSDKIGELIISILAIFAQFERATIIERTQRGVFQRAINGHWFGGNIPFGYEWNKETKELEVVPKDAALVREVYDKYLRGVSKLQIANWLEKRVNNRTVTPTFVDRILDRPIYVGKIVFQDQEYDGAHEPIISNETWQRTLVERERRNDGRKPYGRFLLSGLVYCSECGSPMRHMVHVRTHDKKYRYEYWVCKNLVNNGKKACPTSKRVKDSKLEEWVVAKLKRLGLNPNDIERAAGPKAPDTRELERSDIELRLESINKELNNLVDAIRMGIRSRNLKSQFEDLERERDILELRLDELSEEPLQRDATKIHDSLALIVKAWDKMNQDQRASVIREAVSQVIVFPNKDPQIIFNMD